MAVSCSTALAPLYSVTISSERIVSLEFEPRDQFEQRQKKLEQIQALGYDPYPREFRWTHTPAALVERYAQASSAELEASKGEVRVAGRILSIRLMGKAGFAHLQGAGKRVQMEVLGLRVIGILEQLFQDRISGPVAILKVALDLIDDRDRGDAKFRHRLA